MKHGMKPTKGKQNRRYYKPRKVGEDIEELPSGASYFRGKGGALRRMKSRNEQKSEGK